MELQTVALALAVGHHQHHDMSVRVDEAARRLLVVDLALERVRGRRARPRSTLRPASSRQKRSAGACRCRTRRGCAPSTGAASSRPRAASPPASPRRPVGYWSSASCPAPVRAELARVVVKIASGPARRNAGGLNASWTRKRASAGSNLAEILERTARSRGWACRTGGIGSKRGFAGGVRETINADEANR